MVVALFDLNMVTHTGGGSLLGAGRGRHGRRQHARGGGCGRGRGD